MRCTIKKLKAFFADNKFKKLWVYFAPYKIMMGIAIVSSLVTGATDGALAYVIQPIMDKIFIEKNSSLLILLPFLIIIIYFAKGLFRFLQNYIMRYVGQKVIEELRNEVFKKMICLPLRFFSESATGVLMSRITYDISLVQMSIPTLINLLRSIMTVLGLVFVILYMNWKLALIAIVCYPIFVRPLFTLSKKIRKYSKSGQERMGLLTAVLQEALSGIRVVKAFVSEGRELNKFRQANSEVVRYEMKTILAGEIVVPLMEFIGAFGIAAIVYIGGMQVINGTSTPGTFFSFMAALIMVYKPVKDIGNANNALQMSLAAAERLFEMLDVRNEILENNGTRECNAHGKNIEFRNVSFQYADAETPVLKNINIEAKPGSMIAFVGPSGAGKSTMANLLPRFFDVTEGAILIDDIDLKDYDVYSLRRNIGVVSQEPFLFNDTIRSNIAYSKDDFTEQEIDSAVKAAYADEFIQHLPEGLDTFVGERGVRLSGGQKQRLTIARALLKNPPILILDEATSSLDTESERVVQQALDNLMQGRTSFVIAHRLSTILKADKIVVLLDGKIEAVGTHEELLETSSTYKRLYNMQFAGV